MYNSITALTPILLLPIHPRSPSLLVYLKPDLTSIQHVTMFIKQILSPLLSLADRFKTQCHDRLPNNYFERYLEEFENEEQARAQIDWIHRHRRQTRRGNQDLQREMHQVAQLAFYDDYTAEQIADDPTYEEKVRKCHDELKALNLNYWLHRAAMDEIDKARPRGRLAADYARIQHRRPERLWKVERIFCQLRGGCCSRDCGCCERTWRTIRDPHGPPGYLHCGRSCRCCQRNQRVRAAG